LQPCTNSSYTGTYEPQITSQDLHHTTTLLARNGTPSTTHPYTNTLRNTRTTYLHIHYPRIQALPEQQHLLPHVPPRNTCISSTDRDHERPEHTQNTPVTLMHIPYTIPRPTPTLHEIQSKHTLQPLHHHPTLALGISNTTLHTPFLLTLRQRHLQYLQQTEPTYTIYLSLEPDRTRMAIPTLQHTLHTPRYPLEPLPHCNTLTQNHTPFHHTKGTNTNPPKMRHAPAV